MLFFKKFAFFLKKRLEKRKNGVILCTVNLITKPRDGRKDRKMNTEQKQKIENAIYILKLAVEERAKNLTPETHEKVLKAQNALYDAIGGMDDYKFEF